MKRLVQSPGYQRARVIMSGLTAFLGLVLISRTIGMVGLTPPAIPPIVLGLAMVALAYVRFREYRMQTRK